MSTFNKDKGPVQWVLYEALTVVADLLEDMFWSPAPRPEYPPHESVHWSQEEFREKRRHCVPLKESKNWMRSYNVFVLDEHTITKPKLLDIDSSDDEIELEREMQAWRYVWEHTTIPTPHHHRILVPDDDPRNGYIIMDYIRGERLDHAWPRLSIWSRFRIAWTLRSYVRQLRRAPVPSSAFPGPLGPEPRVCDGLSISIIHPIGDAGPFSSAEALSDLTKEVAGRGHHCTYKKQFELEKPGPLVFTHNDINMRNILLGKDGSVYLIDWDYSGFYPRWLEYISMVESVAPYSRPPCPDWALYCPFIADPYCAYYRWLRGYP